MGTSARTRYALVGVGGRGYGMFAEPLVREPTDVAELVALCDLNPRRLALAVERLGREIPTYTDFSRMLTEVQPDSVIVCTPDATHAQHVVAALEAGATAITEKAMATTAEDVRAILDAERRTGRRVRVTFNVRYAADAEAIKRLLLAGAVGELISVDFAEYLDTSHGADYFRRWHRRKENSGGLMVHKASHHFDQLNWWIDAEPETVYALGARRYYVPKRRPHGERCHTCTYVGECPFFLDLAADPRLNELYLQAEAADGYYRDRCVFSEEIDIEDTMVVAIRYRNGVLVNYALNAFMPYEGQRIGLNGTKGRMEIDLVDRYHGVDASGQLRILPLDVPRVVRVNPLFGRAYEVPIEQRVGGHGGADEGLRDHLFRPGAPDPLGQRAGARAGALSALVGIAANHSIASGQPVRVAELLQEPA